jgi:hypothetical protein
MTVAMVVRGGADGRLRPERQVRWEHPDAARRRHHGVIVGIDGPSYRMRARQQRVDAVRKAVTAGTKR